MYRISETKHPIEFPNDFETTPEGLLALGGNLHPKTLINAYSKGLFPWFSEGDPILWWHPQPRLVIIPKKIHIATRLSRFFRKKCRFDGFVSPHNTLPPESDVEMRITFNRDFKAVIENCREKRTAKRTGTWITPEIVKNYSALHELGYAHSVEVWDSQAKLIGGMYGIAIGKIFFGESMFSHVANASKIAIYTLCQFLSDNNFLLLDCQVESPHLLTLGAENISRENFLNVLKLGETHLKQSSTAFTSMNKSNHL